MAERRRNIKFKYVVRQFLNNLPPDEDGQLGDGKQVRKNGPGHFYFIRPKGCKRDKCRQPCNKHFGNTEHVKYIYKNRPCL